MIGFFLCTVILYVVCFITITLIAMLFVCNYFVLYREKLQIPMSKALTEEIDRPLTLSENFTMILNLFFNKNMILY